MNNKQIVLQILENATIIFNSSIYYGKFLNHMNNNRFQQARYFLDVEMDIITREGLENDIRYELYDKTESLLMDLIINEIEGAEGSNTEYIKHTG